MEPGPSRRRPNPALKIPEKIKQDFEEVFKLFDTDGSGFIDVKDIKDVITSLGFNSKDSESLIEKVVKNHKEKISFSDLMTMIITKMMSDMEVREKFNEFFNLMADNKTGKISFIELRRAADEIGVDVSNEELDEMITAADTNGDGLVTKNDLLKFLE